MTRNLERLFDPRAITVIGASQNMNSISGQPLRYLKAHGYSGNLYPVNPRHQQVLNMSCYSCVNDLPEVPDLAVIVVGAQRVAESLEACGKKGVPFAIVISSGFAETNDAGRALQEEIVDIAKRYGIGIVGPNCQGMFNISGKVAAGFGAPFLQTYRDGPVSLVSQSGGFGGAMLMMAHEEGLGFRHFITTGNEVGISSLDLIEHFCTDPRSKIIAAYIEGVGDARRIMQIGRLALSVQKPILMWKAGNTEAGAKAAASHTANLTGSSTLYGAAFRQIGAIEVSDVADLADFAKAFMPERLPRGNRVAVITTSGGAGIVMADIYSQAGMQIPSLTTDSLARLKPLLPAFASLDNPIDTTAGVIDHPEQLREALAIIAADPNVDCISIACAALNGHVGLHLAEAVSALYKKTRKPVFLAWNAPADSASDAYALVDQNGIPRFRTPVRCARALSILCNYAESLRRYATYSKERPCEISRPAVRRMLQKSTGMTEYAAKCVLRRYGIPTTREALATTKDEAIRFAGEIGYPLAMKVQSTSIPHKTEIGGVILGITDQSSVEAAWDKILDNSARHVPGAQIDGVLLQEQIYDGIEVILGINNDPSFGPAVVFGMGGIFAEVIRDVSVRFAPIGRSEAQAMIREIKSFSILDGARGRPKADLDALADVIVQVSALAVDLQGELSELDINPLFVLPVGRGVKSADALIKPRKGTL